MSAALELVDLRVEYRTAGRGLAVLRGVSLRIGVGEAYGLVGESGCGKSTVALAVMRALPALGRVTGGRVLLAGQDVATLDRRRLRELRARRVAMVYQDAGRALNPSLTVGRQLAEAYEVLGMPGARGLAAAMLGRVRIAGAARVMAAYPHELSGGMQQRVVLGMALAKDPALLVLDEPTTGLDATVEAEVLDLLAELRAESSTAMLFISHNIGVVRATCDRVGVLYAGTLVEQGAAAAVLHAPRHPYAVQLLRCLPMPGRTKATARLETIVGDLPRPGPLPPGCTYAPRCPLADEPCRSLTPPMSGDAAHWALCHHTDRAVPAAAVGALAPARSLGEPVLQAVGLGKIFAGARALADVSLVLHAGETLGLVGESGSGKTTLARLLLGLLAPDAGGVVQLAGVAVAGRARARGQASRKALQIVFQNPDSALNRAQTVRQLVTRSLTQLAGLRGAARAARLHALLAAVRLADHHLPMRPRQLSGGMKQRVAIARAFAGAPRVLVCDEPTSALDVSVQASILNLLVDLQAREGVSYLFISHDLAVVRYVADRIAVLYRGQVVETGPSAAVFDGPNHPYTEALLSALPGAGPRIVLGQAGPGGGAGCAFSDRCPRVLGAICFDEAPVMGEQDGHAIRCHIGRDGLARRLVQAG